MPNIFEYFDYHKYLQDFYNEKKLTSPFFSYRFISKHVEIDPGYLIKVFQGKKNLSAFSAPRFGELLKLNKRESEYFELLILFGKAKSKTEIAGYFEKLVSYSAFKSTTLNAERFEYFQNWQYVAVRELLGFYEFYGDYKQLAKMIRPPVSVAEARKAIAVLLRLGLIERYNNGRYGSTSRFVTTGEEWHSLAVRKFQEQTIRLAGEALERIPKEERDISTLTLSLSKTGFEYMRECLRQCRRQLLEIAEKETNAECVYHVDFQMFPVTQFHRKEAGK
jgi:uncharacterized protein (TIGR02147 family)